MILAELYRHAVDGRPVWRLRAVGHGWADGLADLACAHGLDIAEPSRPEAVLPPPGHPTGRPSVAHRVSPSGDDRARLVQLKYRYHPHDVFRFNRNIPPAVTDPGRLDSRPGSPRERRFTFDRGERRGNGEWPTLGPIRTVDATRTLHEKEGATMHNDYTRGPDLVGCPACAAPAEVVDRYALESTDGPIEHATVVCALRHRFTVLVERLATPTVESEPERRASTPHPT
jgi:hypothetical protein